MKRTWIVLLHAALLGFAFALAAVPLAAQTQLPPLDRAARAVVIDSVTTALNLQYVFADVAQAMEKHVRGKLRHGDYDALAGYPEFAEALTQDLQSISKDKHLRVTFIPPEAAENTPGITPEELRRRAQEEAARRNFGFADVRLLDGNVGYLDLRQFYDATIAGETAIAAMNFLGHVDAMIFDLRQNGGGDPTMIQLLTSYFFDQPTHLNSFYIRQGDQTQQFWTYASVPGPSLAQVPVWVLTSSRTFSGAEEFAYNFQSTKRGTIVGEVTGGGAHPVDRHAFLGLHMAVWVPFGRAINPITQTNWEGVGVQPDLPTAADQALEVAQAEALRKLRESAQEPERRQSYDWALAGLEARLHPVTLEPAALQAYTGIYGPRRVTLEAGALYYQREGRPTLRLIPAGEDFFLVDGLDFFRVRFTRDASGKVEKFVGMYDNGNTDENARTGEGTVAGS